MACLPPQPFEGNSRTIMSGFPGYPQGQRPGSGLDPFANQLLMEGWGLHSDQMLAREHGQLNSPRSKDLQGSLASDVQLRRDIDNGSGAGLPLSLNTSHAALLQLQQQLGGSSGPGSDTAGSVQHQPYQDEEQKPAKRGRGRQRKNTGVETAQQRAHRRFYERKKQRMSALEQEAMEKQEEYQQLLALNTELRRKHEALERAVAGRDEHLILIQALGSLSLDARARQQHVQAMPTLQEQPQQQPQLQQSPQLQQQQQQLAQLSQQQAPQQQLEQGLHPRPKSSPMQPPLAGGSWQHLQDRCESAPAAPGSSAAQQQQQQQQQQAPAELMPEVEEAGPFGLVQLPQYGSADVEVLPLLPSRPAAAAAAAAQQAVGAAGQQQAQQQQQLMSWTADDLNLPGQPAPAQRQQEPLWNTGGYMDLLEGQGMSLTRSLSMPARTGGFDSDFLPAGQGYEGFGVMQGGGLGAAHGSRSFSTTPTAAMGRAGPLRGAPAGADWDLGAFGVATAREGGMLPLRQQLAPGSSRHHSWSGAAPGDTLLPGGLLPKASLSFGMTLDAEPQAGGQPGTSSQAGQLPAMAQLPGGLDFESAVGAAAAAGPSAGDALQGQQQPQAWLQHLQHQQQEHEQRQQQAARQAPGRQERPVWGTVTTTGPSCASGPGQQMLGEVAVKPDLQDPAFAGFQQPWPQQQQQQQPGQQFAPGILAAQQQQQQQQQQKGLQSRRAAQQQPEPQQVVQQLQQMGDMAFSADMTTQMATADMPDDILLFDADMMDMLMERMSQQQSIEMLSPLPSIPSALLTGDSLRYALADPNFVAALAANSPPATQAAAAQQQVAQQQQHLQQQQQAEHLASVAEAAAEVQAPLAAEDAQQGSPGAPLTLLEASRQLQARHMAAGFYPSRSANEMFYVHEFVDWYKAKLQQLQQLLPYVDRPCPDVPCSLSLVQTMEEVIDGVRKFSTRNRIGMWELKLINLETGDFEEATHSHWARVAEHIQLPAQMRESAMACYTLYLEYVEKVKEDRIAVLQDFQRLEQQLDAAAASNIGIGVAPASLQFRVDGYAEYQELIECLQLSLKREHMVSNMLSYSLSQISSHVQMAKGMLSCWPYWSDGPSVLEHWLAQDQARAPVGRPQGMLGQMGIGSAGPSGL